MQFIFKLLITEAVFAFIGLSMAAGCNVRSKPGIIGSVLFFLSIIAFIITLLWWVWFIV